MNNIPTHLEKYCGPIQQGWNGAEFSEKWRFQIIELSGGEHKGISTYSTLGLHKFLLFNKGRDVGIREELIMMIPSAHGPKNLPGILHGIGEECLKSNQALTLGSVIGPRRGSVILDTPFTALYATTPGCMPDEFGLATQEDGERVFILWLIPIYESEANYIHQHGRVRFEDMLVETSEDLFSLGRGRIA